ncbi:MAG: hypothetical protein Q6363_010630 [Candidatus Njordarchaeota archaeon]
MSKDPCIIFVRQAKKNLGLLKKNYWTAGLYFLQAAECYNNAGNRKKAFENAREAVKCLEKHWSYINDEVLPDLEKAISLAVLTAPKKSRKELKDKAFEIYVYHARKLETAGNHLGAAEKYEKSIEFAPSGSVARDTIMKAISILERALQKEHIVKNRKLVEKIENKIEELRNLIVPEKGEEKKPKAVETRYKYIIQMEPYGTIAEALEDLKNEPPFPISDPQLSISGKEAELRFTIPGYSALVEISSFGKECVSKIYSSNLLFVMEIASSLKHFFDSKNSIRRVAQESVKGPVEKEDIMKFIEKIMRLLKIRDEARKIAFFADTLAFVLSMVKGFGDMVEKISEISKEILGLYVSSKEIMPVDAERLMLLLKEAMNMLKKR